VGSRQRARAYQEVATGLLRSPYSAAGPRNGLDRPPMLIDSDGLQTQPIALVPCHAFI